MTIDIQKYSKFLAQVASEIDIPPSKYQDAVDRYLAVGRCLEEGEYPDCQAPPDIYPQGSFRLGTVVRPIRNGVEASYDIDLVSELRLVKSQTSPQSVKQMVGDILWDNGTYRKMLEPEGRRCWTLEYAEQDGVGFHLDVLPAVPDGSAGLLDSAIAITHKKDQVYSWSASDPRGYGAWFDAKNKGAFDLVVSRQKQSIQRHSPLTYASIDEVPDQLVRTPLQRAIQLKKRHRDLHFNHPDRVDFAPISVIITTLAAHLYQNETDVYSALSGIISKLHAHAALIDGKPMDRDLQAMGLIQLRSDGTWYIGNPVNPAENFADRWHEENHARARAFFAWIEALQRDFLDILVDSNLSQMKNHFGRVLGTAAVSKHLDLLVPASTIVDNPPHVHISNPAKPWKCL